ncbi:hypothetical protein OG819_02170 [Streptomyces sp. NBC_01549]|uniref:hypothetical protein n=1 Tax=Streptomyces sp. NBC_01549 TaxID=2975874 RepID=UPI00225C068F|nr:hypothetical protein [Streptomyces sp. NBC_01549]MCX4588589.1 hypothetical protein [Streptomyces sp. NBC_01549]
MFDVAAQLAVLPSSADEMLRLLQGAVRAWRGEAAGWAGCTPEELTAAQERLGVQIPGPLEGFLFLCGGREELMGFQDPLLPPGGMRIEDDVLVIQEENQRCALWGVSVQRLGEPDPPVVFKDPNRAGGDWQPYQDRLSVHLLEAVLNELMISSESCIFREANENAIEELTHSLNPVGIPEHVFWAEPEGPGVKWLAGAKFLVRIDGNSIVWASAPLGGEARDVLNIVPEGWDRADS